MTEDGDGLHEPALRDTLDSGLEGRKASAQYDTSFKLTPGLSR
jgi:hypothetical protein